MSESLRNDGRIWLPKKIDSKDDPENIPENERDYFLERQYPKYGNLVPRDVASRRAREICEKGFGIGFGGKGVYLDLQDSIKKFGLKVIKAKYGNLLEMYERIVGEDPTKVPMKIYPAPHYTICLLYTSDAADELLCVDLGESFQTCLLYTSPSPRDS